MEISIYQTEFPTGAFEDFLDSIIEQQLRYFASQLRFMGIHDPATIEHSVSRAMMVCKAAQIPLRENFKSVYICTENSIKRDWRLSELAMKLVIINSDITKPMVAETQVWLVKNRLNQT
ncbi:MAG: hypothetical protein KatS3mg031_1828 [Chitinophagales bacterium]|nr:MAG: hypothetical protein KatS3mg031_1828 [Chitinophagales bacterium]